MRETANPSEGFTEEKLWASNTTQGDHELIRRNERRKLISAISLLSFRAMPLRLHQMREHVKNTYLPTKLLSRVTDSCMNTSPRLVRKYARIFFRRHYADIFRLYPDTYCIFKSCKKITFIFTNAAKKTN